MAEDVSPAEEPQTESPETPDPAQVAEQLAAFEARIASGEFDHGGFHRAVQQELFPMLGNGALDPVAFNRLVTLWALRNHPFDWPLKPFGYLN